MELKFWNRKKTQEEKRDFNNPDAYVISPYSNLGLTFGQMITNRGAMSLSAVYRCVDLISDSIAMLPIHVKLNNDVYDNHPLYQVLNNRDNLLTKYEFMKLLIQSVLLRGNGFAYIHRNGDGSVKKLQYIEAGDVTINYNKMNGTLYYQSQVIGPRKIEPVNMIHLVKNSYDGVNGISVISYADSSINISKSSEASAQNFYAKGSNLSGIIQAQGQMNAQQRQDIINNWNTAFSGGGQGIAVLPGNLSYQAVQVNAKDAQLLEVRQYNVHDIARFFGVAPSLLGDSTGSHYGSVEADMQSFILTTLQPYISLIENEFNRKLLKSGSEFHIDLDENYLLRANKTATATYYSSMVNNGILTRNEVRRELGYEAVEGGDKLQVAYSDVLSNTVGGEEESK